MRYVVLYFQYRVRSSSINVLFESSSQVFEKYVKKLKNAKVMSGNVVNLTRLQVGFKVDAVFFFSIIRVTVYVFQVQKIKEKFKKSPPSNMEIAERNSLIDCMTICAFLCHGVELLHNWGVSVFYGYLFGEFSDIRMKCERFRN